MFQRNRRNVVFFSCFSDFPVFEFYIEFLKVFLRISMGNPKWSTLPTGIFEPGLRVFFLKFSGISLGNFFVSCGPTVQGKCLADTYRQFV